MDTIGLIPAYNEEKNIKEVVTRMKKSGKIIPLVIDDGSDDNTSKLAKKAGAVVIRHEINKGKGEGVKTGLEYILKNYPGAKYIVIIDADLQYLPEEWVKLVDALKKKDVDYVIGCRDWSKVPFRHRLGNFVWRTTFNFLFGTKLWDTNCGFIAFKRKVAKKLEIYGGYIIDNAMAIQALKNGFKIKNVPVTIVYKQKRSIIPGTRIVAGLLLFMIKEGIDYRLRKFKEL